MVKFFDVFWKIQCNLVAMFAVLLALAVGCGEPAGGEAQSERIVAERVTMSNIAQFEQQIRRDLPIGTDKREVEEYLREIGLTFTFIAWPPPEDSMRSSPLHPHLQSGIDDIGTTTVETVPAPVPVHIDIAIYVTGDDKTGANRRRPSACGFLSESDASPARAACRRPEITGWALLAKS